MKNSCDQNDKHYLLSLSLDQISHVKNGAYRQWGLGVFIFLLSYVHTHKDNDDCDHSFIFIILSKMLKLTINILKVMDIYMISND